MIGGQVVASLVMMVRLDRMRHPVHGIEGPKTLRQCGRQVPGHGFPAGLAVQMGVFTGPHCLQQPEGFTQSFGPHFHGVAHPQKSGAQSQQCVFEWMSCGR